MFRELEQVVNYLKHVESDLEQVFDLAKESNCLL